jgi:hypothetical protein
VEDAFVTKLDAAGSTLLYSTYLGGTGLDNGFGIAVDYTGSAHVTGYTESTDFPTTPVAFDTTFNGGLQDAFLTKLDASGSALLDSTYLGGSDDDAGQGIAVDVVRGAYVTGFTRSTDFPTTPGAFDTTYSGGQLDAFVTKLSPIQSAPVYSTYLGGSDFDAGYNIAVDGAESAYVTGETDSTDFPTTPGAFDTTADVPPDAFVTKLDAVGSAVLYSTYLGGADGDLGFGVAVDAGGSAYVTGVTTSTDFPTTPGAFDTSANGDLDAFVTKLDAVGSALLYSTYLGGANAEQGYGVAVDGAESAYVSGGTASTDFPTTPGAFDQTYNGASDAFVTKLDGLAAPVPASLTLSPTAAENPVGTSHTVTATVEDADGEPVSGVIVRFTVTGSVNTTGSCETDANGQCDFTYQGPSLPGEDAINAYADSDDDGTQDPGEPTGAATKTWVLPQSTPGCEVTISDGGRITAANGDQATFGGHAKLADSGDPRGQQTYRDHGPAQPMRVKSINVLAVTCSPDRTQADIFGEATVDGSGSFDYRIHVRDNGQPGKGVDQYEIEVSNGYGSGLQTLKAGNIKITVHE